jgi:hypothetical protein
MSDYLWDKTGEPDADVERLEALLAGFGHAPRPMELPARVVPFGRRRPRLLAAAGLAAAAALLLASLAGAAALLRARTAAGGTSTAASGTLRPSWEGARAGTSHRMSEPPRSAPVGVARDETAAVEDFRRGSRGAKGEPLAALPRRRRPGAASAARVVAPSGAGEAFEAMSAGGAGGGASSLFESTRLMAKEQLVYALRLTGAKLRDVRQRTRGREAAEPRAGGRVPLR